MLDGDEDATADTLTLDVTVTNIPASNPMIAFNYVLNYDDTSLTVQTANHSFLLLANGGAAFNASEGLLDTNNDGKWSASVLDVNIDRPESGHGVLSRLTVASDAGAAAGEDPLTLTEALVMDQSEARLPDTINNASIAVNQACPLVRGDVDCSGSVLATDALSVLRHIAGLSVFQREPCPDIGTGGPPVQGDVDCTGSVLATDAIEILRYLAALPIVQNGPATTSALRRFRQTRQRGRPTGRPSRFPNAATISSTAMITVLRLTIILAAMLHLAAVAGPGHAHAAPWDPWRRFCRPCFAGQRAFGHTCP